MDIERLTHFLQEKELPAYRRDQIVKAIFVQGHATYDSVTTIDKNLREALAVHVPILPFRVSRVFISRDDRSMKALLWTHDDHMIETVLISPKPGEWSACVSCQIGCAMGCAFCATGRMGIKRNLSVDEITSQVLFWRHYLVGENIAGSFGHIVFMGMGEPFLNWENVKCSIDILSDARFFGFSKRAISVSTSGIVPGIRMFADTCAQINLAISLHFADDEKRSRYMPVNRIYDLHLLADGLRYYFTKNKRKVFVEYIMLHGINDTADDALRLSMYLRSVGNTHLLHVNLIRYNEIDGELVPSEKNEVKRFQKILIENGLACTIRKSMGDDIRGACGQLAGREV